MAKNSYNQEMIEKSMEKDTHARQPGWLVAWHARAQFKYNISSIKSMLKYLVHSLDVERTRSQFHCLAVKTEGQAVVVVGFFFAAQANTISNWDFIAPNDRAIRSETQFHCMHITNNDTCAETVNSVCQT